MYATALKTGELLVAAEFPLPKPGYVSAFGELARRHGDYAITGIAVHGSTQGGKFSDTRAVFFGVGDRPVLAAHFARALEGQAANAKTIESALPKLDADLAPRADLYSSAATKLHLSKVLAGRVLKQLGSVE